MRKRSKVLISAFTIGTMMVAGLIGLKGLGGSVKAEGEASKKTFWLDPRAEITKADGTTYHWSDEEAYFALYFYKEGSSPVQEMWSDFMAADESLPGCYVTEPLDLNGMSHVIFVRLKSSAASANWSDKLNQTGNIPLADAKAMWKVTAGEGDGCTGEWYDVVDESTEMRECYLGVPDIEGVTVSEYNCYAFTSAGYVRNSTVPVWPGYESSEGLDAKTRTVKFLVPDNYEWLVYSALVDMGPGDGEVRMQTYDIQIPDFAKKIDPKHQVQVKYEITGPHAGGTDADANMLDGEWQCRSSDPFKMDTYRIWLDRLEGFETGYQTSIHYWKEGADGYDYEMLAVGYENFGVMSDGVPGNRYLAYYDVSSSIVGCHLQFKVYNSTGEFLFATDDTATYSDGDNAQLYYLNKVAGTDGAGDTYNFSRGRVGDTAGCINGMKMPVVYDAYFTCSPDKNNGYGAYGDFVKTWLHDDVDGVDTWWINWQLGDLDLTDYANGANHPEGESAPYSGEKTERTGESLQTKHEAMLALYTAAHSEAGNGVWNSITKENLPPVIISVGIVLIVAMTGLIIVIRKRRHALR